jgi:signal peptidase II
MGTRARRLNLVVFVLVSCIGIDQVTKYAARELLPYNTEISWLYGSVRLYYIENPGSFLSLGAALPQATRFWLFTVSVALVLMGVLGYVILSHKLATLPAVALALIVGGGSSNLVDRFINNGAVVDFVSLRLGSLQTGVFNVADAAITLGAGLLLERLIAGSFSRLGGRRP